MQHPPPVPPAYLPACAEPQPDLRQTDARFPPVLHGRAPCPRRLHPSAASSSPPFPDNPHNPAAKFHHECSAVRGGPIALCEIPVRVPPSRAHSKRDPPAVPNTQCRESAVPCLRSNC